MINKEELAIELNVIAEDIDDQGHIKPELPYELEVTFSPDPPDSDNSDGIAPELAVDMVDDDSPEDRVPAAVHFADKWMGTYAGARLLRIVDCILPGSHNSAFDKEAPRTPTNEVCQDVSPYKQMLGGIRVFDLRVQFFKGYALNDGRRFSIFHRTTSGRTVKDVMQQVKTFHQGGREKEIIILNFHQFKDFTSDAHAELIQVVKNYFNQAGPKSKIISSGLRSATIREIWNRGLNENVVISYNNSSRGSDFWPGVNQRWIGENTPSNDKLKQFMDNVGNELKPELELRSIQCAKYSLPFFVPKNLANEVSRWFHPKGGKQAYIQRFFIINTDWSLRSDIVSHCIYANDIKAS
ncbi:hypothetical protein [Pseudomonas fluorescens]|uniref:hypothetical protein n=1 Tax=Pseudomonas fluorescens TaxID=294 RepID=UPI001A9EC562|nr:hypothetical protein [Pseudomonas fluorescens]QTD31458.1 hypothetical protein JZM58_19405 [Pseudomonas fluorescens]